MSQKRERFIDPSQEDYIDMIHGLGVFDAALTAIQYNLMIAYRKIKKKNEEIRQVDFCDHSCSDEFGDYDCPADFLKAKNKGADKESVVPADLVVQAVGIAIQAMLQITREIQGKLRETGYPEVIVDLFSKEFLKQVNLFGGNPEIHKHIFEIIQALNAEGYEVNLTTTGGKFFDDAFVENFLQSIPAVLALSADDLPKTREEILALAATPSWILKKDHSQIRAQYGQKRKAIEAIHVANLAKEKGNFPQILFNFVLHKGNLFQAREMMETLGSLYPDAQINPYPMQNAFFGGKDFFDQDQLGILEGFIDDMIEHHFLQLEGEVPFRLRPRLHYWLLLKSVFEAYQGGWEKIGSLISGYQLWQCYHEPELSSLYFQIGGQPGSVVLPDSEGKIEPPTGQSGCFWNSETVSSPVKIWNETPEFVKGHIRHGMTDLAAHSKNKCEGCGFSRLLWHEASTYAGIPDEKVKREYEKLRMEYLGY